MSTTRTSRSKSQQLDSSDSITASLVGRQSRGDGASIEEQIAAMTKWCERQSPPVKIGAVYEEQDISGRKPLDKRTGLKRAVEDVEQGRAQMVLTAYFDRFARSVATRAEVLTRVEAKGGVVMTLDMGRTSNATPVSKFSGVVLAAASEMMAEQAGERTAMTKQANIDKGVPPFPRITPAYERIESGKHKGRLRPHSTNAPLVREACEMRAKGTSYAQIARWLNDHGLSITLTGVESMLKSRLLYGELHFGSFTPNLRAIDKPIIDKAMYRRMHRATVSRGRYSKSERLLARLGILVCETCGARMTANSSRSAAGGPSYPYYRCGNRSLCSAPASIACDVAEQLVSDEAIRLSAAVRGHATLSMDVEAARVAREAAETKLSNAIRMLATLDSETATKEVLDELQIARDAAVDKHERLDSLSAPALTVRTTHDWDALTFDERRGVITATIASALVAPGRGDGRVTIESRELLSK